MTDSYHLAKREASSNSEFEFVNLLFSNSVKKVIHTMTGMEAIEVNSQVEDEKDFLPYITGVVQLNGQRNIMISLVMAKSMAYTMVSFMTAIQPAELGEDEICDGISELVHMIAGEMKAQQKPLKFQFTSSPPFAIVGDSHKLIHRGKVVHNIKRYRILKNDILLNIYYI